MGALRVSAGVEGTAEVTASRPRGTEAATAGGTMLPRRVTVTTARHRGTADPRRGMEEGMVPPQEVAMAGPLGATTECAGC